MGDGQKTARQQAIELLELLQQKPNSRSAEDLLLLVKLYRAENDVEKFDATQKRMASEFSGHYGCVAFLRANRSANWIGQAANGCCRS